MFADVNRVNRSHSLKKDRKYNGQKKKDKRTNNDLQNIAQKTKDRATRNTTKTRGWTECSGRANSCCSTCDTLQVMYTSSGNSVGH